MIATAAASYHLTLRSIRQVLREPAFEIQNLFIPIFFLAVTVGAIGQVSSPAFGVDNYTGFQLPVAILQGVAGASSASGLGMVMDIHRGYFDKLLLTPAPRLSLVLGRLFADGVKVMVITLIIIIVGLIMGAGMESGPLGVLALTLLAGMFGLAYAGIGMSIALKTGNPQASQAGFLVFFPLLFLSPAFAPTEVFKPWLEFLATINPVTYILEGCRSLVLDGWEWDKLGYAALSITGFGAFTLSLTLAALRSRTR